MRQTRGFKLQGEEKVKSPELQGVQVPSSGTKETKKMLRAIANKVNLFRIHEVPGRSVSQKRKDPVARGEIQTPQTWLMQNWRGGGGCRDTGWLFAATTCGTPGTSSSIPSPRQPKLCD